MRYDYKCLKCNRIEEVVHKSSETPKIVCSACDEVMQRQFSINAGGFVIKGGSESINWKEKRYRLKRNDEMAVRQKNRYGTGPKIQAVFITDNRS